jgi:hypothetical protein
MSERGKAGPGVAPALLAPSVSAKLAEDMTLPGNDPSATQASPLIPCPRCSVSHPRHDLVRHLWLEHRLLFDGQRAREPWDVIGEGIDAYRSTRDRRQLARAFELALRVDPEKGHQRVRGLLAKGSTRPDPFAEAEEQGATLCPHCFALVPLPTVTLPAPVRVGDAQISASGYAVILSEGGLVPRLRVEMPGSLVYQGPEPGQRWTRRGALLVFVWPPALAALGLATVLHFLHLPGAAAVTLLLAVAGLAYLIVRIRGAAVEPPRDRILNHAWTQLVPRLHADGFSNQDAAFLAGLAQVSAGKGDVQVRQRALERVTDITEKVARSDGAAVAPLAALWRLSIADAIMDGDPVLLTARRISRCLEGDLPLACVEALLADWESSCWDAGNLARLRALVCERAFEAGFAVADLAQAGQFAPALGEVLGIERDLARLRCLWSMRDSRPWQRCGPATTVFEAAAHATQWQERLAQCPDLLLAADGKVPLEICAGGVRVADALLTEAPGSMEVKPAATGEGFDLVVGKHVLRFPTDPERLARRLERWCHYFFNEFVPQSLTVATDKPSTAGDKFRAREAKACPECRQSLLPRRGDVGLAG